MGQAISAARDDIAASDAAAERKSLEDLDMLQKFADAKLDKFKYELDE
jgi:hypothetical protein